MRKSINGLTAIVKVNFKLDTFSDALFVFYNGAGTAENTRTGWRCIEQAGANKHKSLTNKL